ncbi:MAG: manganese efflux pump [Firmicutes bacterium]|nr:manganese efflux pump [Bacillota bacterium]
MSWGVTFFFNSILLGIGLAMDAFSVSIADGLLEPDMRRGRRWTIAGTFAFFQFIMPVIGWFCVHTLVSRFEMFQKAVPWIALVLLLYIGGKMLIESIQQVRDKRNDNSIVSETVAATARLTAPTLLLQGIATAIDALSVGFAISGYGWMQALVCAIIIAVVTYFICTVGLHIGRKASEKLSSKAGILGGCILIFIGIEIFIRGIV